MSTFNTKYVCFLSFRPYENSSNMVDHFLFYLVKEEKKIMVQILIFCLKNSEFPSTMVRNWVLNFLYYYVYNPITDSVIRTIFHKYFNPKEALISNGVINRTLPITAGIFQAQRSSISTFLPNISDKSFSNLHGDTEEDNNFRC